jgi:hypothetical protein
MDVWRKESDVYEVNGEKSWKIIAVPSAVLAEQYTQAMNAALNEADDMKKISEKESAERSRDDGEGMETFHLYYASYTPINQCHEGEPGDLLRDPGRVRQLPGLRGLEPWS